MRRERRAGYVVIVASTVAGLVVGGLTMFLVGGPGLLAPAAGAVSGGLMAVFLVYFGVLAIRMVG